MPLVIAPNTCSTRARVLDFWLDACCSSVSDRLRALFSCDLADVFRFRQPGFLLLAVIGAVRVDFGAACALPVSIITAPNFMNCKLQA